MSTVNSAEYRHIIFEKRGRTAYITFNRPKALNAMNSEVVEELERVAFDLERDPDVWCVVVTGAGKAFVAGADIEALRDFTPAEGRAFNLHGQQVINRLEKLDKPVICAINGYALGGGLELAMACDFRIMSENAKIGLPETALGIFPGWGGTQRLPRLTNAGCAKYYIFTGEYITAQRAYELGVVQEIAEPERLMERTEELAAKLLEKGPVAVRMAKRAINEGMETGLTSAISFDSEAYATVFATEDRVTGTTAFLKKEKPVFNNR